MRWVHNRDGLLLFVLGTSNPATAVTKDKANGQVTWTLNYNIIDAISVGQR